MNKQDRILDKVSKKTNVSKDDILSLANDLQTKNLNNSNDIEEFVYKVSKMANKEVHPEQMKKIISIIQNNQIPNDINHMI